MPTNNLLSRYIWIVDTIRRVGRITRADLSRRWEESPAGDGRPLARRTFYNYREAIYQLLGVEIKRDASTHEYYVEQDDTHSESMTNWLLNSAAMSGVLSDSRDISSRIFIEEVPSAREHLATFIDAIKNSRRVEFSYHPFSRTRPTVGVIIEPYLLKLFRQRWYVAGMLPAEKKVKTYALDRVTEARILADTYEMSADFVPDEYFAHSFGIVVDRSEPRRVALRTDRTQARYMRALPLHPSQQEIVHDDFSIFYYDLQLTPDFLSEIMSMGPKVTVLSPPELRTMLTTALRDTLAKYDN
ncbi:MAG: WYL domain-containing protein [Muribaculaceae bacterium]|nr:WYL domain-containing protein [Muribaculaceae bacterium]